MLHNATTVADLIRSALPIKITLCCIVLFNGAARAHASLADSTPRTLLEYARESGQRGMNMNVPRYPLRIQDVDRWGTILNASRAQLHFMRVMHERYVSRHNAYLDREAPSYLDLAVELAAIWKEEGLSSSNFAMAAKKLDRANSRIRKELTSIEHSYIDLIEPVLTPEQLDQIVVLRLGSARRNCRVFGCSARWADVELRPIWERSIIALVSVPVRRRIDEILLEYERRLTHLVCGQAELLFQRRSDLTANRIAREQGAISIAEARSQYSRIWRNNVALVRRVRYLHEQTIRHINDALPEAAATMFTAATKQAAFPELYPDPVSLRQLFNALVHDEALGEELRLLTVALRDGYEGEYKRRCDALEAMCIEWGEKTEEGISGYEPQRLPRALRPLLQQRVQLSRDWLDTLIETIGLDAVLAHTEHVPAAFDLHDVRTSDSTSSP